MTDAHEWNKTGDVCSRCGIRYAEYLNKRADCVKPKKKPNPFDAVRGQTIIMPPPPNAPPRLPPIRIVRE